MNAASSIRMSTRFAILLLFVLIPQLWIVPGQASSITLEWADPFDDKVLFIEAGATKLFETKLEGDSLKVDADTMVQHGAPYTAATVGLEGIDDMAIVVNLFKCSAPCDFRISYAPLESSPARTVSRICKANPKPMDSQFKKYFFCRKVYQINSAANGKCMKSP